MKKNSILLLFALFAYAIGNAQSLNMGTPSPEYITESAATQNFTVTLSAAQAFPVSFQYQSFDASATGGTDFTSVSGTIIIPAGQTTATISVPILNDYINEYQEYYYVTISNAINVSNSQPFAIGVYYAYAYINDNDPSITINSPASAITEGTSPQVFTVTISAAQSYPITVQYQSFDSYALSGSDFTAVGGTLTIPAGQTSANISVPILNDYLNEPQEYYYIQITNAQHGVNLQPMSIVYQYAYGYIDDNDPYISIVAPSPAYVNENAGNQLFTVTLSSVQTYPVSVQYQTNDNYAIAGNDYVSASGTLIIPAGQTSGTVSVSILNDFLFEYQENYYMQISNAQHGSNAQPMTIQNPTSNAYIDDNDPSISIATPSPEYIQESGGNQIFTVILSAAQTYNVLVDYLTNTGSAVAGNDFTSTSGTLTILAGQTTGTISVPILNDYQYEGTEYYYLELTNARTGTSQPMSISYPYAYAYIDDNDPTLSLSNPSPQYIPEAGGSQLFTITLSAPQTYAVSVQYQTYDASAQAGSDYVAASGTVTIPAGQTSASVSVNIINDFLFEGQEYYYMLITNAQANGSFPMNILNNISYAYIEDGGVTVAIGTAIPEYISETAGVQVFPVSISAAQPYSISVHYETSNYSAYAGEDFTSTSGDVIIAAGQTTANISVPILNDYLNESTELYFVTLSNAINVSNNLPLVINAATGYGYINDNDPVVSINVPSPQYMSEASAGHVFTVSLSAPVSYPVSFNYETVNANAMAGNDFVNTTGTITFLPGDTIKSINVSMVNDFLNEPEEAYYLLISNAKNSTLNLPMTITTAYSYAYINDDDPFITNETPSPQYITESNTGIHNFVITLSSPQSYAVLVDYSTYNGSALSGDEYIPVSGTVTIPAGQTSVNIQVSIVDDYLYEGTEYYYILLTNARTASAQAMSINTAYAFAYIEENDPFITINPPTPLYVSENAGTQLFTVTLSSVQTYPVAVDYFLNGNYAVEGSDFTFGSCSLTLTFAPGETSKIFSASIIDDGISELTEDYYAYLSNARNSNANMPMTITTPNTVAYILDNDNTGCGTNLVSKPVISGSTLYCPGTTLNLSVASVAGAIGYVWNGPNGFLASGQNITISNLNAIHSGVYTARAYRAGGTVCDTSVGANVNISVLPCASTVSLKAYIEGFYVDSGRMTTVLLNHSLSPSTTLTDSIHVELHQATAPYAMVATTKVALNTNGTAIASFSSIIGSYYIAIKHPTTVQTWSSVPVTLGALPTSYDFTNAASKAYGDNMKQVEPGIWAIFSGDILQDENIDLLDFPELDLRISTFDNCYLPTDLNGDGNTDLLDAPILENNIANFIYSNHP